MTQDDRRKPSLEDRAKAGVRAVKDTIVEAARDVVASIDELLAPPPQPVPIRRRPPMRRPPRRR